MQLVIAEKPSVARSIAYVIGAYDEKNGYIEGNGYFVTWCLGHLAGFKEPDDKIWSLDTLPINLSEEIVPFDKNIKQFNIVKKLMNSPNVDTIIEATDAGREGEAIFRYVYKACNCNKPFKRLWISSMEDEAINHGFRNLKPGNNYDNLYEAAVARDFVDKIIGLNGTRLFSLIYNQSKPPLSVGRVQTPVLNMICERELEIKNFVKSKYYKVHIIKEINEKTLDLVSDNIKKNEDAVRIKEKCNGKTAKIIDVSIKNRNISAPKLYDLTSLQRDGSTIFGYTANQVLNTTQKLYETKLCTYPRADSNYITEDMVNNTLHLIDSVIGVYDIYKDISPDKEIMKCVNNDKVSDHHAIIPTENIRKYDFSKLSEMEKNILGLICLRLLTATQRKQILETTDISASCEGYIFNAKGKIIIDNGFKEIEDIFRKSLKNSVDDSDKDEILPKVSKGEEIENVESNISEHFTKPPSHYTDASILQAMENAGKGEYDDGVERVGLGTTATRAAILENLIYKGYLIRDKKNLIPTQRAFKLLSVIPEDFKSVSLTSDMENRLLLISQGKADRKTFIDEIQSVINNIIKSYKEKDNMENEKKVFNEFDGALGKCPNCSGPVMSGEFSAYCKNKCGMSLGRIRGKILSDNQVKMLLEGKKITLKGLKKKNGDTYDMCFKPTGIEDFSYTNKDGEEVKGKQWVFETSFPPRKRQG